MKQSMMTSTIFKVVLVFTLLFSAFLALAITYNKIYKLKNETLLIMEKYEGLSNKSVQIINNYLKNTGYNTRGKCESGEYGVSDLNNSKIESVRTNEKYYYCISYSCSKIGCKINDNNSIFYNIKLFYKFNLPFLGEIFTFNITGQTKDIKLYSDNQKIK